MRVRDLFWQYSNNLCKMKSFVVFCFVLVAGIHAAGGRDFDAQTDSQVPLTPEQEAQAKQFASECIKETGVSTDVLAEAKKGHFTEDEGLKKFTLCYFKKAGIVDGNGKLNVEVALAKLPPGIDKDAAKKVLESCKSKTGKDAAEIVFEIFKCYHAGPQDHVLFGGF